MKTENTNIPSLYGDEIEAPPPAPGEEQFIPQQSNRMIPYNQWPPMHLPPPILHTHEIFKILHYLLHPLYQQCTYHHQFCTPMR